MPRGSARTLSTVQQGRGESPCADLVCGHCAVPGHDRAVPQCARGCAQSCNYALRAGKRRPARQWTRGRCCGSCWSRRAVARHPVLADARVSGARYLHTSVRKVDPAARPGLYGETPEAVRQAMADLGLVLDEKENRRKNKITGGSPWSIWSWFCETEKFLPTPSERGRSRMPCRVWCVWHPLGGSAC